MLRASSRSASAEGWKLLKPRSIQRRAPFTTWPNGSTTATMKTANAYSSHWKRR